VEIRAKWLCFENPRKNSCQSVQNGFVLKIRAKIPENSLKISRSGNLRKYLIFLLEKFPEFISGSPVKSSGR
jgi:hypothetical protein